MIDDRFDHRLNLIPQEKLKNARLYSTRYHFIETLPKNINFLEAGVLAGDFAMKVIEATQPKISALIDPYQSIDFFATEYGGKRWADESKHYDFIKQRFKYIKNVKIYKGYFENVATSIGSIFDFIYIDACNDYMSVFGYLEAANNLLAPGGIIGINDYSIYENNTESISKEESGVVEAVNDYLIKNSEFKVHAFAFNDSLTSDIYLIKQKTISIIK
jgi:hypothetical protein